MKIKYFQDTDTLYIEFRQAEIVETKDFDENTLFDMDAFGNVCGIMSWSNKNSRPCVRRRGGFLPSVWWCLPWWAVTCYDLEIDYKLKSRHNEIRVG